MTAWVDYRYYESKYLAGRKATVSVADFSYYAVQATARVKRYAAESITDTEVPDEAKHAVCAVCEVLCERDKASSGIGVTSEKTGDLSVTYASEAERSRAVDCAIRDIVYTYLADGGYLYRGVMSC